MPLPEEDAVLIRSGERRTTTDYTDHTDKRARTDGVTLAVVRTVSFYSSSV
jgi:hypothetical protein